MKLILTLLLLTFSLFANIQGTAYQVVHFYSAQVVHFSVARDTYGTLLRHTGSSDAPFLFTGEQYDPEAGLYYLRARYYSPELSRFLTRDTYEGTLTDPITQNPYAYANDNPLRYVDPSGHTATSTGEVAYASEIDGILGGIAQSKSVQILLSLIQRMPAIVTSGIRVVARDMAQDAASRGASLTEMEAILTIARLYSRFGDHSEDDKIPIQVYGSNNLPEHQDHIFDAILGLGSNGRPVPFVLHRKVGKRNDGFLNKALCTQNGKCRDEYPYNTTYEGGEENYYKGLVSVRYVSRSESSRQGAFINTFYSRSPTPLMDGDTFIVIPIGPKSGYFDKTWKWHSFPEGWK